MPDPGDATQGPARAIDRRGRWKKLVLFQAAALVALLTVLEAGFRVVHLARGRAWDASQARWEIYHVQSLNQDFTPRPENDRRVNPDDHPRAAPILHPFLGFEVQDGTAQLEAELRRLRERGPDPAEFVILILGGSVAAAFSQEDLGAARFVELLAADARLKGRAIHLLKFGRGGFKEPQQANLLLYLLALGFEPDAVLDIDGFNEVALGNANATLGTNPVFPSAEHWGHLASFTGADREGLDILLALREKQRAVDRLSALALDWSGFDGLYFYNPFVDALPDELAVRTTLAKLGELRSGARVVTYHGFGAEMPSGYRLLAREPSGTGQIEAWQRSQPAS